jgi:hypothetical protein
MNSAVFSPLGKSQGIVSGEMTIQMAQDLRIISNAPLDIREYLILCGKIIQDRIVSHPVGPTEQFKFKFLIETSRRLGQPFQLDRKAHGGRGLISSRAEFSDLIAVTDTWVEPWLRVIQRYVHMNDIMFGGQTVLERTTIPYYGFNPIIQNSISILQ